MTYAIQKNLFDRVQAAVIAGNAKIEALDKGLQEHVIRDRKKAIRERTASSVEAILVEMRQRQQDAKQALPFWTQEAARRRAKFHNDPATDAQLRVAYLETLKRAPTGALEQYLADAIHENSIARAEAVRLEFMSRPDQSKHSLSFSSAFGAVVDQSARNMEADFTNIDGLAEYAGALVQEFTSGFSNPAARMAGARMAGMAKPPVVGQAA